MQDYQTRQHQKAFREQLSGIRVAILLRFSILIISYIIFVVPLHLAGFSIIRSGFWPIYGIFAIAFILNITYRLILYKVQNLEQFILIQLITDTVLVSGLVYLTGANYSNFVFLYFAVILASSMFVKTKKGFFLTTLCTVFLVIITGIYLNQYFWQNKGIPPFCAYEIIPEPGDSIYLFLAYLTVEVLSFYLVFFLSNDLTRRLQSVRLLYDEVLLNMAEGMMVIDRQDRIQFINEKALKLLRFTNRSSLIGTPLEEVFRRTTDQELKYILTNNDNIKKEINFYLNPNEALTLEIKSSIINDEKGRRKISIVILRDVSFLKKALESEKRLTKLEAVREMSSEIAHEIKNPLASILGSVQELKKIQVDDDIHQTLIRIVSEETERINEIVNGFLSFARMPPTQLEKCNISSLLEEIVILLKNRIIHKKINIESKFPADLYCEGDKNQLKQVFLNLGINAIDAIQDQGTVSISAKIVPPNHAVDQNIPDRRKSSGKFSIEINISDNGIGIDSNIIKDIFKPFFTTKSSGTGMGLSIVDWIIHAHNGKIDVRSKKGQGTTFTVVFPAI